MRKLLLTLLLLFSLGLAAKAETEELTPSLLNGNNTAYNAKREYTSTKSGLSYKMGAYINGSKFQQNKSKGCFFEVTANSKGVKITNIQLVGLSSKTASYFNAKASDSHLTVNVASAGKGTGSITGGTAVALNGDSFAPNNTFFSYYVTSSASSFTFSKIIVTYESNGPSEPQDFSFDGFKDYDLYVGKSLTLDYPADAPEIALSTESNDVVAIENNTITALAPGVATISASWNAVDEKWNLGSKDFKVTVTEAPDGLTIQFISDGTSDSSSAFTTRTALNSFITEGTEYVSGIQSTNNVYKGKGGLKFSSKDTGGKLNLSLSADAQIYCKQIVVRAMKYGSDSPSLSVNGVSKDITATEYTDYVFDMTSPYAKIETLELAATKRLYVQSVMLVEAKPELVSEPSVNIKHGSVGGVLTVDYTFTVAHYDANKHSFEVTLSVDGNNDIVFKDVTPAVNAAPARANAESTVFHKVMTAKHESLKGATPQVSVVATLNGAEVHNKTYGAGDITTTGIEDVMVEGEGEAEYFNLQGLRVAQPEAGQLYIKRQGGNAVKVRF